MSKNIEKLKRLNSELIESFDKALNGEDPNNIWSKVTQDVEKIMRQIKNMMNVEIKLQKSCESIDKKIIENEDKLTKVANNNDKKIEKESVIAHVESWKNSDIVKKISQCDLKDLNKPSCKKAMSKYILDLEREVKKFYQKMNLLPKGHSIKFSMDQAREIYDKYQQKLT